MKNDASLYLMMLVFAFTAVMTSCAANTNENAALNMDRGQPEESIQLLEQQAAKGDDDAMVQLGIYYAKGIKVKQNYARAMDWFLEALTHKNADAFVNIGVMHRDGLGVPKNNKIAYCVFLTTHMLGLGSQGTQSRSNSCLRRMIAELSKDDVKDCLSNYTPGYIAAYLESRGEMTGIPDRYKPSAKNPALKDTGWFMDSELDAIYGEPTEEEKKARKERDRKRQLAYDALKHTMVFQIRFPKDVAHQYGRYEVITNDRMSAGPLREKEQQQKPGYVVSENDTLIWADRHRYVSLETETKEALVFRIDHPVKPGPCDWSKWQKANFVLGNSMESYVLLHGRTPKSMKNEVPPDSPELRFKVVKE